ncbi:uncharacterized protein DSM5745_04441 [Aspergillus mulundensis]|uniref:Glucose-methanol-choline oxidoreductase N-terminal domain-containing protein n=1 Tax=Aspergillus mulundensis TaxID=1810919 RepID=A0A3D8SCP7_9EURO|nr:hypothetical protein DSM5745_04441 [Aspergillus mulundensis]RDW84115.1 hypothetical protein DSM5745_04441 [Aspergillus mulundensis]
MSELSSRKAVLMPHPSLVLNSLAFMTSPGPDLNWKPHVIPRADPNNRIVHRLAGRLLGSSSATNGHARAKPRNLNWRWETSKPKLEKSVAITRGSESSEINPVEPALVDGKHNTSDFLGENETVGVRRFTATTDSATRTGALTARLFLQQKARTPRRLAFELYWEGFLTTLAASKDVILPAGAFHTPKLLESSGIGDKERLEALGIAVLHTPGEGENLQNHPMAVMPVPLKGIPALATVQPGIEALTFTRLDRYTAHNQHGPVQR